MNKKVLLVWGGLMCLEGAKAQEVDYPCSSNIADGKYEKAEKKIFKALQKEPDATVYFAAYMLYAQVAYPSYDVEKAYDYLEKSREAYGSSEEKRQVKLQKHGYSTTLYDVEAEKICQSALDLADQAKTVDAYEHYLTHYKRATENQHKTATNSRNALIFENVVSVNTVEEYERFIKKYPMALEVPRAKMLRNKKAYEEADLVGTVAAYKEFVSRYPQATECGQAMSKIYKLEYDSTTKQNVEQLSTIGYGQSRPAANNNTADGRKKNRRVEIKFIK